MQRKASLQQPSQTTNQFTLATIVCHLIHQRYSHSYRFIMVLLDQTQLMLHFQESVGILILHMNRPLTQLLIFILILQIVNLKLAQTTFSLLTQKLSMLNLSILKGITNLLSIFPLMVLLTLHLVVLKFTTSVQDSRTKLRASSVLWRLL